MKKQKNSFLFVFDFLLILFIFAFNGFLETGENTKLEKSEISTSKAENLYFTKHEEKNYDFPLNKYEKEAQLPEFGYDFDYVVGVVAAESRGEPCEGQVAVAQCILETSRKQMITPEEVVKMKSRYASPCKSEDEKNLVIDACIDVFIHGEKALDEPIEYFYSTRGGFVSDWHEKNLEYVGTIGNHKFFKEK